MAADVVGNARLVAADDEGAIARLRALREELIDLKLAGHQGRTVKLMGDGALGEFGSVVDAVRCAAEIRREMATRNADIPEDQQIVFRIGVNLGDIIIDDDIQGDGVNIAARLEGLAEPGGIIISATSFDQAPDRLDLAFEDIGEQTDKNIPQPVRAYRALLEPSLAGNTVASGKHSEAGILTRISQVTEAFDAVFACF